MSDQFPVYVESGGQRVRVGTATRDGDGFLLQLGSLSVGGTPVAAAARAPAAAYGGGGGGGEGGTLPNYGRSKGMPIRGASLQDLEFYINGAKRTLNDPSKERFHGKERTLLAQLEAEVARQGGGGGGSSGGGGDDYGPPPPGDEDAPF